ncbi:hypothetical protein [Streptomyces sp. 061-3]|uniref:hypothetical protein n=1 Tax=Streptomyces sp. 061-3 TaxID=2789268 RepID=UPI00398127E4
MIDVTELPWRRDGRALAINAHQAALERDLGLIDHGEEGGDVLVGRPLHDERQDAELDDDAGLGDVGRRERGQRNQVGQALAEPFDRWAGQEASP